MTYKMRKPLVKNKYNLTIKQLKKYKVVDRTHVGLPFFWRNDVKKHGGKFFEKNRN